jgi:hypothetical protein
MSGEEASCGSMNRSPSSGDLPAGKTRTRIRTTLKNLVDGVFTN